MLTPFVGWLERIRLGRIPAVLIVLTLCFALAAIVGWSVAGQLLEITSRIPDYRDNIEEKIHALHSQKNAPLIQATDTVRELNKELAVAPAEAAKAARNKDGGPHPSRPIPVQVTAPPSNFLEDLRTLAGPLAGPLETAFLVIVFVAFMLINREDLRNRLIRLGGQGQLTVMTQALEDASERLSRYLLLQFLVNAGFGILFGLGLYLIGVPHALLWGALSMSASLEASERAARLEQSAIVANQPECFGFLTGLRGLATYAANLGQHFSRALLEGADLFEGEFEHRFEKAHLGIADGKLCRVDSHSHAPATGVAIVARQRTLASFIELEIVRQGHA